MTDLILPCLASVLGGGFFILASPEAKDTEINIDEIPHDFQLTQRKWAQHTISVQRTDHKTSA